MATTTTAATSSHGKADSTLKIILIGSSGVGKTSLIRRYTDGTFSENSSPTIGVDFEIKIVQVQGHRVALQMWDTAGQEKFKNVVAAFYRNADGVIMVFDITNMETFTAIESWFVEVQHYNTNYFQGLLVGNKRDVQYRRVVDPQMAIALANRLGMAYVETSAKDCTNVSEIFSSLAELLLQHRMASELVPPAAHASVDQVNIQPRRHQKPCSQGTCFWV